MRVFHRNDVLALGPSVLCSRGCPWQTRIHAQESPATAELQTLAAALQSSQDAVFPVTVCHISTLGRFLIFLHCNSQVSQATAQAQTLATVLQSSPNTVFPSTVAKAGSVAASSIQTFVKVVTAGQSPAATSAPAPPAG